MAQCNTIFTAVYYFLESFWSGCRPIVNSKSKWLNPLKPINSYNWSIILGGRVKTPSENRQMPTKHSMIEQSKSEKAVLALSLDSGSNHQPCADGDFALSRCQY